MTAPARPDLDAIKAHATECRRDGSLPLMDGDDVLALVAWVEALEWELAEIHAAYLQICDGGEQCRMHERSGAVLRSIPPPAPR